MLEIIFLVWFFLFVRRVFFDRLMFFFYSISLINYLIKKFVFKIVIFEEFYVNECCDLIYCL